MCELSSLKISILNPFLSLALDNNKHRQLLETLFALLYNVPLWDILGSRMMKFQHNPNNNYIGRWIDRHQLLGLACSFKI